MPLSTDTPYGPPYDPAADEADVCDLCGGSIEHGCHCPICPVCDSVGDPNCEPEGHFETAQAEQDGHGRGDGPLTCTNGDHDACLQAQLDQDEAARGSR